MGEPMSPARACSKTLARNSRGLAVAILVACGLAPGCGSAPRPNIVLITIDTLRADALVLAAGGERDGALTPQIARLAAQGTVFTRATAPMSLTRPSHFSIFTGRYPREHGVVNNQIALPASETTIAEMLQRAGYRTGGFVAVRLLAEDSGAGQGFDRFVAPESKHEWSAARVVGEAEDWLAGLTDEAPFFLWVHFFDPHQPYDPPADLRRGLDPDLAARFPALGWREFLEIAKRNHGQISQAVTQHARALYRAEVAGVDREIGRLLARIDAGRAPEDTMVVLTADHGECFENGIYFEHSDCLLEGGVRVPLIVRHPATFEAGARISALVSNADVAPTLVRAAGQSPARAMTVPSLQQSGSISDRYVLLQNPFYPSGALPARQHRQVVIRRVAGEPVAPFIAGEPKLGIVRGAWKYLRSPNSEELYASGVEVGKQANLALREPAARLQMHEMLDHALQRHPQVTIERADVNPELLRSLRALGYIE